MIMLRHFIMSSFWIENSFNVSFYEFFFILRMWLVLQIFFFSKIIVFNDYSGQKVYV